MFEFQRKIPKHNGRKDANVMVARRAVALSAPAGANVVPFLTEELCVLTDCAGSAAPGE